MSADVEAPRAVDETTAGGAAEDPLGITLHGVPASAGIRRVVYASVAAIASKLREAHAAGGCSCAVAHAPGAPIDDALVYRHIATTRGLVFSEAQPLIGRLDVNLARGVPRKFLEHYRILPVCREGDGVLVATSDPDASVPELAHVLSARAVELRLVTPLDFRRLRAAADMGNAPLRRPDMPAPARDQAPQDVDLMLRDDRARAESIQLLYAILLEAIAERASDVHIERYGPRVRVRLRVDGDLHDAEQFEILPEQLQALVNVVKINSALDIAERRVPQGGRFSVRAGERRFDLRVQTQPALHGEHVVIRLLSQDTRLLRIEELGFPAGPAKAYRRLLNSPAGLLLVVGPTGSGKSTTLYAGLQELSSDPTRKVITAEDPIEYSIEGVQQTQVRPDLGFGFASAMRSFVREDPDVILVGEIRDAETALEALRASQTGHLVLSTLHCNDAVDAVQRLVDLEQHPNSIASELVAVFAQRLAKRICTGCRAPDERPDPALLAEVFPSGPPEGFKAFAGAGCAACSGRGAKGRVGVVEYLPVASAVRAGISRQLPVDELRALGSGAGLLPMREHALELIDAGTIAFRELRDLLPPDRLGPRAL